MVQSAFQALHAAELFGYGPSTIVPANLVIYVDACLLGNLLHGYFRHWACTIIEIVRPNGYDEYLPEKPHTVA
jgi:hypothetical protein